MSSTQVKQTSALWLHSGSHYLESSSQIVIKGCAERVAFQVLCMHRTGPSYKHLNSGHTCNRNKGEKKHFTQHTDQSQTQVCSPTHIQYNTSIIYVQHVPLIRSSAIICHLCQKSWWNPFRFPVIPLLLVETAWLTPSLFHPKVHLQSWWWMTNLFRISVAVLLQIEY